MNQNNNPVRVLIVDDSAIIRSLIERGLSSSPDIKIVGFASNGEQAITSMAVCDPDVVVLDIEMPVMDGITALPQIKKAKPDAHVIICSTLSDRGADISLKALSLGATDYILKPTGTQAIRDAAAFHEDLTRIVLGLGKNTKAAIKADQKQTDNLSLVKRTTPKPQIVAIGSSTGGPNALIEFFKNCGPLPVPVIVTQHMPAMFTSVLAKHIQDATGIHCCEAADYMKLEAGKIYIAPGGYHLLIEKSVDSVVAKLDDGILENFCKPAVDPMMRSVAKLYGANALAIILTGMGSDGLAGCQTLFNSGATIIAQDEVSSVVWGMPKAVASAGICSAILNLQQLAEWTRKQFNILPSMEVAHA